MLFAQDNKLSGQNVILREQSISCPGKIISFPNKILPCANKVLSCSDNLKNKTSISLLRFGMSLNGAPSRKHAYSNKKKSSPPKLEKNSGKKTHIFHTFAQNIDCGYSSEPPRRGGSDEYPQFMFFSKNKENNVYPCKPQFYYIKVGFKGVKNI